MPSFTLAPPGEDKTTILALLRNDPKTAYMQTRKRRGGEGACNPA